jgi:predicted amino acid dehydrogenase
MNPEANQNAMILGEMRGQLREVVHSMNNLSMKFDGLTREVVALGALATIVGKLEAVAEAMDIRIKKLEAQQTQVSTTASNFKAVLNSPVLGWIFLVAVALWVALREAA